MPTRRDMLKLSGHPFFERMRVLRQLFASFEEAEDYRGGIYQDAEIEMRFRGSRGHVGEYEPEALIDYGIETCIVETMHRLCQIVLLYSTFESLCSGTLRDDKSGCVDNDIVKLASKRARKERKNFVLALLDVAQEKGMQSSVWPGCQRHIEAFVVLRGHLVHEGLEVTDSLRTKLQPLVEAVDHVPGGTLEEKLDSFGQDGSLVQIPRSFVSALFDQVEQLAADLIVLVDSEAPDINSSIAELLDRARQQGDDDQK